MKTSRMIIACAVALCAAQSFAETHTVTFRRMNGTVFQTIQVAHGANATSRAPALPAETGMTTNKWDCVEKLANVTNDVTCWALYEASTAKSPSTSIASQSVASRETPYSLEEYFKMYDNLAWSDEFSGSSLDVGTSSGWWGGTTGGNWQNDTEQGDLDLAEYTRGNNHSISNGILKLNCRRESATKITSARINSKGKVAFKKGRCEIRAKISKQVGTTPAFWTMGTGAGWPWGGEIDVMEQVNGSEWIQTTLHMAHYAQNTNNKAHESGSGLIGHEDGVHWGDGFHRMGIVVNERELVWYVDDHICQRMDIRDAKYDILRDYSQYILLNLNFGGSWAGQTNHNNSAIANFQSDDFEIDYCRIFTNTNDNNTVVREPEPEGARLSGPVKATVWRGWQMKWGKGGAGYYQNHLIGSESVHIRTAVREYCGRDNPDIVTFFTRPQENTGGSNLAAPLYVPGYTTINLSPNSGRNWTDWDGDIREKLRSTVLFNKGRFSQEDSSVSNLEISNDYSFTNGCAVVAELVEKDTGAKVKVVSAFVSTTNDVGTAGSAAAQGFDTLISKINAMKDEKVILLLQGEAYSGWSYLNNRVNNELKPAFAKLGQYTSVWPVYQSAWATSNYTASAENPAPLSVRRANGQASGVHTNQSFCATVQFEAPHVIEYGQIDMSGFAKKMTVTFGGAQSGTTLTDFPVLVKLSTAINGFSYSDFQQPNGADLRFADSTGTLLPHEIDTWNPSGVSTVWVKVPSLAKNTTITACWGNAGELPEVAAKDVWDENYVGVWHLGESALPLKESSETSSDFKTSNGSGIGYASSGIVGKSVDFGESGNSRSVVAPDHAALDGFTACTFEAWTYIDATARSYKKDGSDSAKGLLTKRTGYGNQASYHLWDAGSGTSVCVSSNSTSHTQITGISNVPAGEWVHQVVTFNAGSVANYKGGAAAGTGTTDVKKVNAGDANLHLGNFQAGDTRNFPGKVDEVRISKVARSAAWVKATHDTIADASFAAYAVDGVSPDPTARILYVPVAAGVTNTLDAALVTEYITNIVKQGAGTLIASAISNYKGDFTIEGGVFSVGVKDGAGKDKYANTIYVGPNASLEFTGTVDNILDNKKVVLEGAAATGAKGKFVSNGGWNTIGTGMTFTLRSDAEFACMRQRMIFAGEVFDLGGHTMTVKNAGSNQANFNNSIFRNGGHVVVGEYMTILHESGTLTFETPTSGSPSVTLMSNATFNLKTAVSASGWTLYATNSNATITGNATRWPNNVSNAVWDGRLVLGGNNKIASYSGSSANVSNNVFNLKGTISGSGMLNVGPGWLNLHTANNTYSGAVWVNGRSAPNVAAPILAGGGGIGLWNGAACFPNASSVVFTNTARLAFMDNTACTVPDVKFIALAGETQSISGGVYTARSTIAGITKEGAGTLVVDSPAQITGIADIQAGTLKVAYAEPLATTQEGVLAKMPQFASLKFASGTALDLSDNVAFVVDDVEGLALVTNSGLFGVTGKWTLRSPTDKLTVTGQNARFGDQVTAGCIAFQGATFEIPSDKDAAFVAAAEANGGKIEVARANCIVSRLDESTVLPMPTASAATNSRWSMEVGEDGQSVLLVLAPASGYAAWIAGKGITGTAAEADKVTNGIANGVRYAFDIDPATSEIGTPIIDIGPYQSGNLAVKLRALAEGRDDVTYGVLATEALDDWTHATFVPYSDLTDGTLSPSAVKNPAPAQMFFKYKIEIE